MLRAMLIILAAALTVGCVTLKGIEDVLEPVVESAAAPAMAAATFFGEHDRWPDDARELEEFARGRDMPVDASHYETMSLTEQADGSLLIEFLMEHDQRTGRVRARLDPCS